MLARMALNGAEELATADKSVHITINDWQHGLFCGPAHQYQIDAADDIWGLVKLAVAKLPFI